MEFKTFYFASYWIRLGMAVPFRSRSLIFLSEFNFAKTISDSEMWFP